MAKIALPIDNYLPAIQAHLLRNDHLVLAAEPGAGKTTRLPPALLEVVSGQILVLEPRRMAALAAAQRIASENNWFLGREVGYQVRFDSQCSMDTRIIFMTEALLSRRLSSDPQLAQVGAVVLDEFHERSLHVDLALGLLKELNVLGRKIKIIVMSATLETKSIADFLGEATIVEVPGKLFPLQIHHAKSSLRPVTDQYFFEALVKTIKSAFTASSRDLLVFLPGLGEIEHTQNLLAAWAHSLPIELFPLHGSLSLEKQKQILCPSTQRRIILATNIAESSITIDGVDTVVDSGLAKIMRHNHRTGFGKLELSRISMNSATQRSGRAARQFPGHSYRLWTVHDEQALPKKEVAEIQRADLCESLLFLAGQGLTDFRQFPWFESPQDYALKIAERQLRELQAVDTNNRITDIGRKLLLYPLHPRLARLMLKGDEIACPSLAAEIVAILQERDFLRSGVQKNYLAEKLECDVLLRLNLLNDYRTKQRSQDAVPSSLQQVLAAAKQIRALSKAKDTNQNKIHVNLQILLAHAFPDRICRRRGDSNRALMLGGRGVQLSEDSLVRNSEFFIALSGMDGGTGSETNIRMASQLSKDLILSKFKDKIRYVKDVYFDDEKNQFYLRSYHVLEDLPLEEPFSEHPSPAQIQENLASILSQKIDWVKKQNPKFNAWLARWNFYAKNSANHELALTTEKIHQAFEQAAIGATGLEAVVKKDLIYFFETQFEPIQIKDFNEATPERLQMPSGSWLQIHYPNDKAPYLEVRIQEVFSMQKNPVLMHGKLPLTLHLLGPNYRPMQITSDLNSFWKNGYVEVRKELRARYPKHSWPEDPLTAAPQAKGRPTRK